MAATFDLTSFVLGPPAPLFESNDIANSTFFAAIAASPIGTIARVPGDRSSATSAVWVDRSGRQDPQPIAGGHTWEQPRLSPDGSRVAVGNRDGDNADVWIVELARHLSTRFTLAQGEDESPIWSKDRILFRGGVRGGLQAKPADGSAAETEVKIDFNMGPGSNPHFSSVSPDGASLAAYAVSATNGEDVFIVDLNSGRVTPFAATAASERAPMFSPDGRWIAYVSDESGRDEVYVRPYPGPGGKFQVSTNGGGEPVWNRNGRELFYRENRKLMSVALSVSPAFTAATPTMLFEGSYTESHRGYQNYDVSPDGQRFVMIKRDLEAERVPIQVAVDMIGELRRLTAQAR